MSALSYVTVIRPGEEELNVVRHGLERFNERFMGDPGYVPISIFAKDHEGRIVGGVICAVYWNAFSIELMWLDESQRGQGVGSRLIRLAEREARAYRCDFMHVDTMSFQALDFYRKQGFELFGTLPGYRGGVERYFLHKPLTNTGE